MVAAEVEMRNNTIAVHQAVHMREGLVYRRG